MGVGRHTRGILGRVSLWRPSRPGRACGIWLSSREVVYKFPLRYLRSAGDNEEPSGEVGDPVYGPFRCGGIELSEECAEGRHGRMVEGEKGETAFPLNKGSARGRFGKRVFCKMTDSGLHRIKERSPVFRLTAYASTATPQYVDASTIRVSPGLLFTPEPLKSPQRSCRPRPEKRQGWRSLRAGST